MRFDLFLLARDSDERERWIDALERAIERQNMASVDVSVSTFLSLGVLLGSVSGLWLF